MSITNTGRNIPASIRQIIPANYSGTSQGMESSAALEIWARSVTKHSLTYTTYVGDGDSSSFKRLRESDPYKGLENLRKEECIRHAQGRLKKALRKKTTKTLTSKPIPPSKVQRIGHLYALVIVQNRRKTAIDIQKALYTLLTIKTRLLFVCLFVYIYIYIYISVTN